MIVKVWLPETKNPEIWGARSFQVEPSGDLILHGCWVTEPDEPEWYAAGDWTCVHAGPGWPDPPKLRPK